MEPWSATHQSSHSTSDILPTALTAAPNAANASTAFQYAAAAPSDVLNLSLEDAWLDHQQSKRTLGLSLLLRLFDDGVTTLEFASDPRYLSTRSRTQK